MRATAKPASAANHMAKTTPYSTAMLYWATVNACTSE
jgi:hypothetical protein